VAWQRVLLVVLLTVCSTASAQPINCRCRDDYSRRGSGREYQDGGRSSGVPDRRRAYDYDRRREYDPRRRSSRSRSRSPARAGGYGGSKAPGRDASDVFRDRAGGGGGAGGGTGDVRARYGGDASGKLDLYSGGGGGSSKRSADEVFRLGGRNAY
jgi:hypothetical protein